MLNASIEAQTRAPMTTQPEHQCRPLALFMLIAAMILPGLAHASRYRVDAILFMESGGTGNEQPVPARSSSSDTPAIDINDTARLAAAGITMLPSSGFALQSQWQHLRHSGQFQPLMKLSWIQNSDSSGTALQIGEGTPITLSDGSQSHAVSGHIALYTGTFLHLDTDLAYTSLGPDGTPVSYRMDEVRRVKFNELHYIDSPRLGVLAQVTRVQ